MKLLPFVAIVEAAIGTLVVGKLGHNSVSFPHQDLATQWKACLMTSMDYILEADLGDAIISSRAQPWDLFISLLKEAIKHSPALSFIVDEPLVELELFMQYGPKLCVFREVSSSDSFSLSRRFLGLHGEFYEGFGLVCAETSRNGGNFHEVSLYEAEFEKKCMELNQKQRSIIIRVPSIQNGASKSDMKLLYKNVNTLVRLHLTLNQSLLVVLCFPESTRQVNVESKSTDLLQYTQLLSPLESNCYSVHFDNAVKVAVVAIFEVIEDMAIEQGDDGDDNNEGVVTSAGDMNSFLEFLERISSSIEAS